MKQNFKITGIVFLIVSTVGFLDATYLTIEHFLGNIPPCTIAGCEVVLTSAQSTIVGIPVALLGSLYYLTLLILSIFFLNSKKVSVIQLTSYLTIFGVTASAYFVYLQLFVIEHICQYCMISAGTSTTLFIIGMYTIYKIKKSNLIK